MDDLEKQPHTVKSRMRLPTKLKGGKLRSAADVVPVTFVGGLVSSLPSMIDRNTNYGAIPGILSHLTHLFGPGTFDVGNESARFATFLSN